MLIYYKVKLQKQIIQNFQIYKIGFKAPYNPWIKKRHNSLYCEQTQVTKTTNNKMVLFQ
jgi:hypothetical protein